MLHPATNHVRIAHSLAESKPRALALTLAPAEGLACLSFATPCPSCMLISRWSRRQLHMVINSPHLQHIICE